MDPVHTNHTAMTSMSLGGHFVAGTRVDCLFDGDYFRGTVDSVPDHDDGDRGIFRVCFDDGDIRDDVPRKDMKIPLEPGSRVECLFEVRPFLSSVGCLLLKDFPGLGTYQCPLAPRLSFFSLLKPCQVNI